MPGQNTPMRTRRLVCALAAAGCTTALTVSLTALNSASPAADVVGAVMFAAVSGVSAALAAWIAAPLLDRSRPIVFSAPVALLVFVFSAFCVGAANSAALGLNEFEPFFTADLPRRLFLGGLESVGVFFVLMSVQPLFLLWATLSLAFLILAGRFYAPLAAEPSPKQP